MGLSPLTLNDAPTFKMAFADAGKRAWCYYVPYLLCYAASPKRAIVWRRLEDALALFLARSQASRRRLDILVPPIPPTASALRAVAAIVDEFNRDASGRVLWVEREDVDALNAAGWRVEWKEDEYLYAPRDSLSLRGTRMRTFRRHVNAFTSRFDFECEAYSESHREECLALLRAWRKTQGRKHRFLLDVGYTKAALDLCGTLPPEDLFGEVVMVNGRVVAFAFAGRMSEDLANFFVAKADPALDGLSYFLRWRMFRRLSEYGRVNDAGDLGHPGLAQFKRSLRPVEMLPVFRARRVSIE